MYRRSLLAMPALLAAPSVRADWAPRQPIRIVVGFAAGGAADLVARIAADAVQRRTGHAAVVEIRSGALGFIALQAVARAVPDGHTVGICIMGSMSVAPAVPGSQIPLDLDRELLPVCNLAGTPMALVARPDAPFGTVAELVAYAKARPGEVSYASTGNGSTNQLAAEHFAAEAGLRLLHVSYRGGAPAALDLAGGRVDIMFANVAEVAPAIHGGQIRALALAATQPSPLVPDLPLLTRDLPALDISNWFGLVGPAGLPPEVAQALARLFLEAMADPATTQVLAGRGLAAIPEDGPAFAAHIRRDRERWSRVAAQGNIRAE
ncbi:tripartite tricarboxylate transporter substrate binding protein [Siccirubricoccus sp. G192]|uniref:Bug family tripartite tricarboxylate transporter substrate binding protein n=1 Tax=Siccirubricoccus sp. G192 TaxID=2849651 RepID=UPI001C2BA506|nr:tripartite tricarboxylate transporter substrate binding protein [Siccirubricoccus sp. G192]MBV1798359.1 tripartite tricarboxylate transporter substrate binding protein [Siccirubricoccus sp. G192]